MKNVADFLSIADLSTDQFWSWLERAKALKEAWRAGGNQPILAGKSLALLFQKPSLRTRVSFEMGMTQLGGYAFYLSPQEIRLGERESVADVARVISGYVDGVMARVFDHQHLLELSKYASIPIINGLSDFNHPCQVFSDLFTLYEHWHWADLRGKHLVYVGDGNNVAHSLLYGCSKVGMDVTISSPPGYEVRPDVVAEALAQARRMGSKVNLEPDPQRAVAGADAIYTDVWTSMGQEEEQQTRKQVFPPYQVNESLVEASGNPDVVVLHCLPAHRGEEITDAVADGPHSLLFPQAHNRLHGQKAILAELLG